MPMRLLRFTQYLLSHRLIALAMVFLITFVPVIGVVGILYAGFVTLRKSIWEGGLFTLFATIPYAISFYAAHGQGTDNLFIIWAAVGIAIFSNLFTWVLAGMLAHHVHWSKILQIAALMGVLCVSVIHLVNPNISMWWGEQLHLYFDKMSILTDVVKKPLISTDSQMEAINVTKQYATGLITMAILFNAFLQLIVSRWWQMTLYHPGMLRRELHVIRLSKLAGGLFILSFILAYLGNRVVLDIMPILYMLFGMAGLSLVHYLFGLMTSGTKWFWLWLFYITLVIALPTSIILLSLLALADVWLDIRRRLKKL